MYRPKTSSTVYVKSIPVLRSAALEGDSTGTIQHIDFSGRQVGFRAMAACDGSLSLESKTLLTNKPDPIYSLERLVLTALYREEDSAMTAYDMVCQKETSTRLVGISRTD